MNMNFKISNQVLIGISVFIFLALCAGWVWWFLIGNKKQQPLPVVRQTPSPTNPYIFRTFNIETDQFLFLVQAVNPKEQTMQLQFLFPAEFGQKVVTSKIACALNDSRVTYTFGPPSTNQTASATKALYLYPIKLNATVFRGRCGGPECNVITGDCELIIQK